MGLPMLYVTFVALPVFVTLAWSDFHTKLIDTRPLYALIGLAYGGYFANGVSIWLAISVSIGLLVLQWANNKAKLKPWGSGDFPLLQAFGLILMLFSPTLEIFIMFFLVLLIFTGLWIWYFKDRSFAPAVAMSFFVFGLAKLLYI